MAPIFQRCGLSAPKISTLRPVDSLKAKIEIVTEYEQLEKQKIIEKWIEEVETEAVFGGEIRRIMTALPRSTVPVHLLDRFDAYHARQVELQEDSLQEPSYYQLETNSDRWYGHFSKIYARRKGGQDSDALTF